MFASFKKLFRKDTGEDLATSIPEVSTPASATHSSGISGKPVTLSFPSHPAPQMPSASVIARSPDSVAIPLQSVLARLPNSLSGVVQSQGNGFVSLPALWILQELPKGAVKISFGELRQVAPPGTFFENSRHDQVLIELPLDEIVARLNPSHLARRKNQKQVVVPPEVSNVFGPRGEGIFLSSSPSRATKPTPAATPVSNSVQPATVEMPRPQKPVAMSAPISVAAPAPAIHVLPTESETSASGALPVPLKALVGTWPEGIEKELSTLNTTSAVIAFPMVSLEQGLKAGKIVFTWEQICEWIQPPVSNSAVSEGTSVEMPLHVLAPLFLARRVPKAQKKITIGDLPDLFNTKAEPVSEPVPNVVEAQPAAPATIKMPTPATQAIPFTPVAPAAQSVFSPIAPAAPISPIAPAAPVAIQAPPPQAVSITPTVASVPKPNPIGDLFGQPTKFSWSPNDIVRNLTKVPGISGAFVAMTDGLLVAANLPPHLKAETVAAFLPQIFGRMNQYAKELQLGSLSSFSFVAENVSWQILKNKTVYLVAIGKPGESLPGSTLDAIATELGQQIQ